MLPPSAPLLRQILKALLKLLNTVLHPSIMGAANETLARFFERSVVNFPRFGDPDPDNEDTWRMYEFNQLEVMNLGKHDQRFRVSKYTLPHSR